VPNIYHLIHTPLVESFERDLKGVNRVRSDPDGIPPLFVLKHSNEHGTVRVVFGRSEVERGRALFGWPAFPMITARATPPRLVRRCEARTPVRWPAGSAVGGARPRGRPCCHPVVADFHFLFRKKEKGRRSGASRRAPARPDVTATPAAPHPPPRRSAPPATRAEKKTETRTRVATRAGDQTTRPPASLPDGAARVPRGERATREVAAAAGARRRTTPPPPPLPRVCAL